MPSKNHGRMAQDMKRELIAIIQEMKDPRVTGGLLTVTRLDVTPDLDQAKVHISVLDKSNEAQVLKGLKSASGYLRRELGRTLNLRNTPQLSFVPDDSIDKGAHILSMLRDPNVVKPVNPDNHYGEDQEDEE